MELITEFWEWAWARHANPFSWYIRPLFLLPFVYYAYKRSWRGISGTMVALATSMFWFPVPENPDPQILSFLAAEREYLVGEWTPAKVALTSLVPLSLLALAAAFWRRSLGWGLLVLNGIAVAKTVWSVVFDESGAAVIAPALVGLVLTNTVVVAVVWWRRKRPRSRSEKGAAVNRERVGLG